jgi:hypothetical protein
MGARLSVFGHARNRPWLSCTASVRVDFLNLPEQACTPPRLVARDARHPLAPIRAVDPQTCLRPLQTYKASRSADMTLAHAALTHSQTLRELANVPGFAQNFAADRGSEAARVE